MVKGRMLTVRFEGERLGNREGRMGIFHQEQGLEPSGPPPIYSWES